MKRYARRGSFDLTTRRKQAVVYRAYDSAGQLLYIGCTVDFKGRMAAHRTYSHSTSPWYPYATRIEQDAPLPFDQARAAESKAIAAESPWFNGDRDQSKVQIWRGAYHRAFDKHIPPCGCGYEHMWFDPEDDGECGRLWEDHVAAAEYATEVANREVGPCRDVSYRLRTYLEQRVAVAS